MSRLRSSLPILHLSEVLPETKEKFFYAGRLEELPPSFEEYDSSHRHSYYAIFFFEEGDGVHSIDFREYRIEAGSVFFLKPGQVHSWKFQAKPKGFALKVSPEFYTETGEKSGELGEFPFFSFASGTQKLVLRKEERIFGDFQRLVSEFQESAEPRMLHAILRMILFQLQKEYESSEEVRSEENLPVSKFQILLESNFLTQRSVSFYARRLGLVASSLNRICQNSMGKSAKSMIHDRVLLESKRYLLHSEWNIGQICRELGFADNAYFSRYFKARTGISPEQFREKKRKAQ